jgi:hypothetical protein
MACYLPTLTTLAFTGFLHAVNTQNLLPQIRITLSTHISNLLNVLILYLERFEKRNMKTGKHFQRTAQGPAGQVSFLENHTSQQAAIVGHQVQGG